MAPHAPTQPATPAVAHVPQLQELRASSHALRGLLEGLRRGLDRGGKGLDQAQLKQQRWEALVLLSSLKAGLRETFVAADAWKTRVQEHKDLVEAHQLRLQNLLYEKDHLVREIRRCRGFSTKEMDRIEFADGPLPIAGDPDVHRRHLDQLTHELETRKQMKEKVKEIKAEIEIVEAATLKKASFLEGLRGQLDVIEDSTGALQQYMRMPVTTTLRRQHAAANQLPVPLYTLYCELEAYQTASGCTRQLALAIVDAKGLRSSASIRSKKRDFPAALLTGGRVRSADEDTAKPSEPRKKRVKAPSRSPSMAAHGDKDHADRAAPSRSPSIGRSRPVESGEIVDAGAAGGSHADERGTGKSSNDDREVGEVKVIEDEQEDGDKDEETRDHEPLKDLWRCSEKALQVTLSLAVDDASSGSSTSEFALLFQHFPVAEIVTVEIVGPSSIDKDALMNLFPGDDGRQLPRSATAYKLMGDDHSEIAFPFESVSSRPYHWVQWICGLYPLQRPADAGEPLRRRPEPSIRSAMQQLIRRLVVSVQLKAHLAELGKGIVPAAHPSARDQFPMEYKAKLSGWKEISKSSGEVNDKFKSSVSESEVLSTTGCRYYRFVVKSEHVPVEAIVEISHEFPVRAPRFRLKLATPSQSDVVNNHMKEIEIEVNTFYDELVTKDCHQYVLVHQIRKILQCVDVLNAPEGNLPRCFGRERRGKDRRPALVVDPVTKEIRHR